MSDDKRQSARIVYTKGRAEQRKHTHTYMKKNKQKGKKGRAE